MLSRKFRGSTKLNKLLCSVVVILLLLNLLIRFFTISTESNKLHTEITTLLRLQPNYYNQNLAQTYTYGIRIPEVETFVMNFQFRYTSIKGLLKLDSQESYNTFLRRLHLRRKRGIALIQNITAPANTSSERYNRGINQFYMYDPEDNSLDELLKDMSTLPIVSTDQYPYCTCCPSHCAYRDILCESSAHSGRVLLAIVPIEACSVTAVNQPTVSSLYTTNGGRHNLEVKQVSPNGDLLLVPLPNIRNVLSSPGQGNNGTQLKLELTLKDGSQGKFKPMRQIASMDNSLDAFTIDFFEHYQAEIAGFHLDRVLGFHKAIPTVGRVINMTTILSHWTSDNSSPQHVYRSHTGNLCMVLNCLKYCGMDYPFCGHGDSLPGALSTSLPPRHVYSRFGSRLHYHNNWFHTHNGQPEWKNDEGYCNRIVKKTVSFHFLMEIMDLAAFDFLAGNLDRFMYERFEAFGAESFAIAFDNGRGFGQPTYDHMSLLAPIRQCCLIRLSTLAKFIKLYKGPDSLGKVMRASLNSDLLSPVLREADFNALDRRLGKVIKTVSDCLVKAKSWDDVVFDDLSVHTS